MHSQETSQSTREQERRLISVLADLGDEDDIVLNDVGWDSRVYVINEGQFVFKFPRSQAVKQQYRHEIAAYKVLATIESAILVPRILWQHPDNAYFGYSGVIGVALDRVQPGLDNEVKEKVGTSLGRFLSEFHQIRMDGVRTVTIDDEIAEFQHKYAIALPVIIQEFSQAEQARLEGLISLELPHALRKAGSETVLCHGDLGYWNVIYGNGGEIGIIDFGDIGYYDRSKDFIGLDAGLTLEAALRAYGDDAVLREKIRLRTKVLSILDLSYYIGKQDRAGIQKTLLKIREYALT